MKQISTLSDGFITKRDMANRFNRTPRTIEVWMRTGILPYYKVGRSVFFRLDDVERHFEQQYRCIKKPTFIARLNNAPKPVSTRVAGEGVNMHTAVGQQHTGSKS